ncbi:selenide, water dikinase SelD [Brevirhabdus pacifica]|nr:selenide, water dikinase SelD [Brevirhabdus pacifica]
MDPLPGVRLTLIDPQVAAPYTGMLPGHVAGHYTRQDLDIDLVALAGFAGARLVTAAATGIDLDARTITLPDRPPLGWDLLSIDIGITSSMDEVPGFAEHAVAAKPLGAFARRWEAFRDAVAKGDLPGRVAVIGGGVAGVELALAMAHALRRTGARHHVTVIERDRALSGLGDGPRQVLLDEMARAGITLQEQSAVQQIDAEGATLTSGARVEAALVVGAAGARPFGWLADTGLDLTDGFISVGPGLQSVSHASVFAAGDCAALGHAPRPKAGVFAVRQAPVLFHNLRARVAGGQKRRYDPQGDYLKLISLGDRRALAVRGGLHYQGPLMWRWKDRIDQAFMDKFRKLPVMRPAAPPARIATAAREMIEGAPPLCGGCGAKIGAGTLQGVLADLEARRGTGKAAPPARSDVLGRIGDDAAILSLGGVTQVLTTDHLRGFLSDPLLMGEIAAVHALGDIWSMGATAQSALVSLTLPRMSPRLQRRTLTDLMAGISGVVEAAGAEIVGGHTAQGAEMILGLTITGLAEDTPITHAGAHPGDALILTRPVGSGILLAGMMQNRVRGAWAQAATDTMCRPQGDAAAILRKGGARAMTDVTGFGLAGHLLNLLRASDVGAEVTLSDVPLMAGAADLARAGIRASLLDENRAAVAASIEGSLPERAEAALLFDPQTAGGLLAALPADQTPGVLKALQAAGHTAARIGTLAEGPATLRVV